MMVSISLLSAVQENIFMGTGFSNDAIISSFDFISKFPDQIHKTYCHPYGGFHSFDSETIRILNQEQVDYSFNVLPKDIDFKFNINDKHSLPRFDCNEFPFGAAS